MDDIMYGNGRKTIGVFMCSLVNFYQKSLCTGIIEEAKKLGYNVAMYSSFELHNDEFMRGEIGILDLPDYGKLDGVILVLDSMEVPEMKEKAIQQVKARCHCPVVCIRERNENFHNVLVDDRDTMREMIDHFLGYHRFKDVCFLAGPEGYSDSDQRLDCFIESMEKYGLPVTEKQIRHGHFWKNDGAPACKQFIDERGKIPDAIICANDYMAISVCNELIERGLSIPDDVAVCGCDNIWETTVCAPSLSTVQVPFHEMAHRAVDMIDEIRRGVEVPKDVYFPIKTVKRESCGCVRPNKEELMADRKEFYDFYERQREHHIRSTFMSIALEEVETLEELTRVVGDYGFILNGMEHFHICFCTNIENYHDSSGMVYTPSMYRCITVDNKNNRDCHVILFPTSELLPGEILDDGPQAYIFIPLHYKGRSFGYTAISYEDGGSCDNLYRTWVVNVNNAIQDMLVRAESEKLYQNLESTYIRDALTGLYNRRGFSQHAQMLMNKAKEQGKCFFVVAADLDKLKFINDTYGHAEGDRALIAMARALKMAAGEDTVCARMGGDEYSVAGICDNQKDADAFLERLEKCRRELEIHVSYGMIVTDLKVEHRLEYYMNLSDSYMYQDKVSKRKSGGEIDA